MPVHPMRDHGSIPRLDEPAKVLGLTVLVAVECQQCEAPRGQVCLVNAQPAACPKCGAILEAERVTWDSRQPIPSIAISASPSRAKQLLS